MPSKNSEGMCIVHQDFYIKLISNSSEVKYYLKDLFPHRGSHPYNIFLLLMNWRAHFFGLIASGCFPEM